MICNFFNKVRFLTNKLKLLIFMKKPFLHLHLSLLFLMGCVFLLPSCIEDKAEDAAHRLVVSKVDVELIQTGMLNTGSKASFDVLANRGYVITSDAEWLDVDKPTGKGRVSVTLEAKPNETAGERTGHLTVTSGKLSERVTVTQTLDPDPDDGNPVGYTRTVRKTFIAPATRCKNSAKPGFKITTPWAKRCMPAPDTSRWERPTNRPESFCRP